MYNLVDLADKKILITGASSGIGRETSILLSRLGARVVLVGRREMELRKTQHMMENFDRHRCVVYDLLNIDKIGELVDDVVRWDNKKMSGLVHCAGQAAVIPLNMLNYNRMDKVMKIHYFAFVELVRYFSLKKNSDSGSIVGISSIAARRPAKCQTIYAAAKAAVDASIRSLAQELSCKKIRINTVVPGLINTPMAEDWPDASKQILGIGQPEDIANMIAFLLADVSKFMTGRRYYVDGGFL